MNKFFNPEITSWSSLVQRPLYSLDSVKDIVDGIFNNVELYGDKSLIDYTNKFDNVKLTDLKINADKISNSEKNIGKELKDAINIAFDNIYKFHENQIYKSKKIETTKGVLCWQEKRAIENVGLYIPGGTAPLFSSVLMLAIPAMIAKCKNIVLCSPPDKNGELHPAILYCAKLCKVDTVICVGGAQSIAAMSIGTETVPKVNKIFGPGNQFVTVAKQLATKFGVAIDMPAGPSELLVMADASANASYVAADLLSQAEHGADSQVILVATSQEFINQVSKEVAQQILALPRKELAQKAIDNSKAIFVATDEIALALINEYGPEHFILCTNNNEYYLKNIENAGSVFIGNYTPESAGDYASGTNHTLPTNGFSKAYSGVNLDSFLKSITFQEITQEGILNLGNTIEVMAAAEGLAAHKNAVTVRLNDLQ